ncbi:uncharacterized protein LOC124937108 [Impatiens glandulifera]|uniref:uncharacterized protein LOC124937108 n=1 Tax=Impatiens glandulifera TaxID=253017 RepID=UPI001FB13AEE|nr:uncharacterized protein LOC124937108 [Impatiens glandulifera]
MPRRKRIDDEDTDTEFEVETIRPKINAPAKKSGANSKRPRIEISPVPKKTSKVVSRRQSPQKKKMDPKRLVVSTPKSPNPTQLQKQNKTSKQPTPSHDVSTLQPVSSAGLETQSARPETFNNRALVLEDPIPTHPTSNVADHDDIRAEDGIASVCKSSKTYIEVNGENFIPDILKDIHRIVTGYWRGPYLNWNQVPEDIKNTWWEHFTEMFEWDLVSEGDVNKLFKKKAGTKIRNFITRAKAAMKKPPHVTLEDWAQMKINFEEPKYSEKCTKAKGHRHDYTSNGGATYCGGSITAEEHQRRLARELGRLPTILETFEKTFKKKDGTWSGSRAAEVVETFSQLHETQNSVQLEERKTDTELWMEAAGSSTSGRVFGIGYMGRKQVYQDNRSSTKLSLEVNTLKETVTELKLENSEKQKEVENCKLEINTLKDQFAEMIQLMKKNGQPTPLTNTTPEGGDV